MQRTLRDWLDWQERLHPGGIDLGLERVRRVFQLMDLGPPPFRIVTIAGTNGKGSSVALLEAILNAAGYRVGAYTSPHLLRYNERIRIAGAEAGDAAICRAFERIDRVRGQISLTYFEFGTLAALDIFYRSGVDVVLLEVGMGGRLDAVNIMDPDVALVTAIGIDHVAWLGGDRETIAREKAGIFRAGRPAVCSDPHPPASLVDHAHSLGVPLSLMGRDYDFEMQLRETSSPGPRPGWSWWGHASRFEDLPLPRLRGTFQVQNAAGVLMALQFLFPDVGRGPVEQGLRAAQPPGRFQLETAPVVTVLDVAHNRDSARTLAENLAAWNTAGRIHAVVAMLADKDMAGVLVELSAVVDIWHVASAPVARGASAADLEAALHEARAGAAGSCSDTASLAYRQALAQAGETDRIVVFGSFYAVSDVKEFLAGDNQEIAVQSDPI